MTELLAAAREVFEWLDDNGMQSCLIGGLAVQRWGEPRLTRDVDLTVLAQLGSEEAIVDALLRQFRPRLEDARAFALQARILLLQASNGVPVDLALGATSFEADCIRRATAHEFLPGCRLPTCTAEDLILHKAVAARPQDIADIRGIVARQHGNLDLTRIRHWLQTFADVKEDPDLALPFEDALRAAATVVSRRKT